MKSIKLYALTAPFALLPLMDFSLNQVPKYLKGIESRAFLAEVLTQITTGIVDAYIIAIVQATFGVDLIS